jgi:hypothetical protein
MSFTIDNCGAAGMPNIKAELRVLEPTSSYPLRGTVLFTKGDDGNEFLSDEVSGGTPNTFCVAKMMNELAEIGFRVIDARWDGGWKASTLGHRREAARYATLVKFLHRKYIDCSAATWPGPFIAVGSSSGAAQIAYALTTYNMSRYIDLAILASGPPEARLDLQCGDASEGHEQCDDSTTPRNHRWCDELFCIDDYYPDSPTWSDDLCSTAYTDNEPACPNDDPSLPFRPPCIFKTTSMIPQAARRSCAIDSSNLNCADYLNQNSILYGNDDLSAPLAPRDFPRTTVHTILALQDDTQAPAGGLAFYDYVNSRKRLWYFDSSHTWITDTGTGAAGRKLLKYAI